MCLRQHPNTLIYWIELDWIFSEPIISEKCLTYNWGMQCGCNEVEVTKLSQKTVRY